MKRTTSALALTLIMAILFSVLAGTVLVNVSKAFVYHVTDPAAVKIDSPAQNGVYSSNNITISVSVESPNDYWEMTSVQIALYLDGFIRTGADAKKLDQQGHVFTYNSSLNVWKEGQHNLSVVADIACRPPATSIWPDYDFTASGKSAVQFELKTLMISVLSIENRTYNTADLSLDFVVSKPVLKVAYCLDDQANVTIAGNTTLRGLSKGGHSVTVYAWDTAGNIGASETVTFSVAEPFPTIWVIIAAAITAATAGVAIAIYYYTKNRKAGGSKAPLQFSAPNFK
jgi:hypothetical protein